MSDFESVGQFHAKFGLPFVEAGTGGIPPGMVDDEVFIFRYQFLIEELHELLSAHRRGDLPGVADALADLAYVVLGTSHYYGVPFDAVFEEIHRANLTKERSGGEQDPRSKRSSGLDVVKPRWWTPPDVGGVLRRYGWTG